MLSPAEFASWLQLGDFSVSVPRTDNFSISILESMGCGTVPVLANLQSYQDVHHCQSVHWLKQFSPSDFAEMFRETAESCSTAHEARRADCFRFAQEMASTERAIDNIEAFYLGLPLTKNSAPQSDGCQKVA